MLVAVGGGFGWWDCWGGVFGVILLYRYMVVVFDFGLLYRIGMGVYAFWFFWCFIRLADVLWLDAMLACE